MKSAHHNALTSNGKRNSYHVLTSQGPLSNRWENPHRARSEHAQDCTKEGRKANRVEAHLPKRARRPKRGKEPEKKKAEKGQEARKEKTATAFGALRGREAEKRGTKPEKAAQSRKGRATTEARHEIQSINRTGTPPTDATTALAL